MSVLYVFEDQFAARDLCAIQGLSAFGNDLLPMSAIGLCGIYGDDAAERRVVGCLKV